MDAMKLIVGCYITGAAILFSGACNPWDDTRDAVLVEETYTVCPGDTLWGIAEEYLQKNTATRRYILEYKAGMEELNPWLLERHGMLYPGDRLKLTYWVRGDEGWKQKK